MTPQQQVMMELMRRRQQAGAPQGGPRGMSVGGPAGPAPAPSAPRAPRAPGGPQRPAGGPSRPQSPQAALNQITQRMPAGQRAELAGLLQERAELRAEARTTLNEARDLYEDLQAWDSNPSAAVKRKWKSKGPQLLAMFDANPGLANRFVISPMFRNWVRVNAGYEPPTDAPADRGGAPTPGLGLLADGNQPEPAGPSGKAPTGGGGMY